MIHKIKHSQIHAHERSPEALIYLNHTCFMIYVCIYSILVHLFYTHISIILYSLSYRMCMVKIRTYICCMVDHKKMVNFKLNTVCLNPKIRVPHENSGRTQLSDIQYRKNYGNAYRSRWRKSWINPVVT